MKYSQLSNGDKFVFINEGKSLPENCKLVWIVGSEIGTYPFNPLKHEKFAKVNVCHLLVNNEQIGRRIPNPNDLVSLL